MLSVEMLAADRGDCLLIHYGPLNDRRVVVVDGGITKTGPLLRDRLIELGGRVELLVVTHIDLDHIAGALDLLRKLPSSIRIGEVWFNDFALLPGNRETLAPSQGESLAARISHQSLSWNRLFDGGPIAVDPDAEELPTKCTPGGLKITVLGPTLDRLRSLRRVWKREIEQAGLSAGSAGWLLEGLAHAEDIAKITKLAVTPVDVDGLLKQRFESDSSVANGSSIALLLAYGEKRLLLAADSFSEDIERSVRLIVGSEGAPLELNAVKLSHHGGRKNTSTDLLDAIACQRWLFSTDGSYYEHPSKETVARVLRHGRQAGEPHLYFNYSSKETLPWQNRLLRRREQYYTEYPTDVPGLVIHL